LTPTPEEIDVSVYVAVIVSSASQVRSFAVRSLIIIVLERPSQKFWACPFVGFPTFPLSPVRDDSLNDDSTENDNRDNRNGSRIKHHALSFLSLIASCRHF
jgi:hypothetical protein